MPQQSFATTQDIGQKNDSRVLIEWRALSCPKAEYNAETTEDRWAANAALGLFAVADGVGSSYRAADWALALVDAWTQTPFHAPFSFEVEWWLRKLQPQFAMSQADIAQLQPYAQPQARQGAGSTLLGLRLWPASDNQSALYQLLCIGDSDLLHYPRVVYPIANPGDFGTYPVVLRSRGFDRRQDRVLRYPDKDHPDSDSTPYASSLMRIQAGDTILLCTDAIARWALETDHAAFFRDDVESALAQLEHQTPETWQSFVEEQRQAGRIVDDDTTTLFIRIAPDQQAPASDAPDSAGWRRVKLTYPSVERAERSWAEARRSEMATARAQQPQSALEVARIYGDGRYFGAGYRDAATLAQLAQLGRERADALELLNDALRAVSWERPTPAQMARVQELRERYGATLSEEPLARGALATMLDLLSRSIAPTPKSAPKNAAPITILLPLEDEEGAEGSAPDLARTEDVSKEGEE
jgi:serine/threonine protein phosphatase PrpC